MNSTNPDLVNAFPSALRGDALKLISVLPDPLTTANSFSVVVGKDTVWIPYRIYHDPSQIDLDSLTQTQKELLACLLTRHHSGFVRGENLAKILDFHHEWLPPFVVQLVGEYVIEIIRSIRSGIHRLDHEAYRQFLIGNPLFYRKTKARVVSYWNCYHQEEHREDYAAFQVLAFFDGLIEPTLSYRSGEQL